LATALGAPSQGAVAIVAAPYLLPQTGAVQSVAGTPDEGSGGGVETKAPTAHASPESDAAVDESVILVGWWNEASLRRLGWST
jgi:hypothetical protein